MSGLCCILFYLFNKISMEPFKLILRYIFKSQAIICLLYQYYYKKQIYLLFIGKL